MENVSKAIGTILKANTAVTDIVGHGNIFHARIPQNNQEDTVLRFYVEDVDPVDVKNHSPTMFNCFVRMELFSNNDQDLTELATSVREALDRYAHGVVNDVFLAGVQFLKGKHFPDDPDGIDLQSYVQMYKFRVDISSNVIVMNYSLTEVWTGDYWIDGTTKVYAKTFALAVGADANQALTGLTKTWTLFREQSGLIQAPTPTGYADPGPTAGTTDYEIYVSVSADTPNYYVAYYVKITIT